ncbi:MAG: LytTR family DNA-binding domain-containing protein [Bacteroidota bacterium]
MIKAIIVEDEEHGRRALELKLKEYCPEVKILAFCASVEEAVESINQMKPQLVFLDVRLHRKTGFDVLMQLETVRFEVIFVSGYEEYAIKAFREGALDFILKPIDVEELKTAVEKAKKKWKVLQNVTRLVTPISTGIRIIPIKQILYCKAENNFTRFFLQNESKTVMTPRSLRDIQNHLPEPQFFRIHRSFLINLCHVKEFHRAAGGYIIMENGDDLSVSASSKEELLERLASPMDFCQ